MRPFTVFFDNAAPVVLKADFSRTIISAGKNKMPAGAFVQSSDKTAAYNRRAEANQGSRIPARQSARKNTLTACRTMMSAITCHYILLFYSGKLNCIALYQTLLCSLFVVTYVVGFQLDSVSKDVSGVAGFLKDFIKCILILRNTNAQTQKKVFTKSGSGVNRK